MNSSILSFASKFMNNGNATTHYSKCLQVYSCHAIPFYPRFRKDDMKRSQLDLGLLWMILLNCLNRVT